MIEHIARYPRVRDRAVFVGRPRGHRARPFGPGLPAIRDWTAEHFSFAGYVTGFDPAADGIARLCVTSSARSPTNGCCLVTVGGSGVGAPLLRRVIGRFALARRGCFSAPG